MTQENIRGATRLCAAARQCIPAGILVKHLRNESSTIAAAPSAKTWLVFRASRRIEGFGPALQTPDTSIHYASDAKTDAHTCTKVRVDTHSRTCAHTRTHAHMHTSTHPHAHTHMRASVRTHPQTHTRTHKPTQTHKST